MKNISHYEIHKKIKEKYGNKVVIIEYPFHVGGQIADRTFWMATIDGEVKDYHLKEELIREAEKRNRSWVVIRYHKDKTVSIIASSFSKGGKNA